MAVELFNLQVEAESIPCSFNLKRGGQEVRPAPLGTGICC